MKKYKKNIIIFIILIIILTMLFFIFKYKNNISQIVKRDILQEEEIKKELFSYIVYDTQDDTKIKILVKIASDTGIEYVKCPNGEELYAKNQKELSFDYEVNLDEEYIFKIKELEESNEQEGKIYVDNEVIEEKCIQITCDTSVKGCKTLYFNNKIPLEGYNTYYSFENGSSWIEGNQVLVFNYDFIRKNLVNEDNTIDVYAKVENNDNKYNVITKTQISIDIIDNIVENNNIESESIIYKCQIKHIIQLYMKLKET